MTNTKHIQRIKFLLFIPVIVIPFACLIFSLLGGGQALAQKEAKVTGLNANLPAARTDTLVSGDKLSFYAVADADSARRMEQIKLDPYRKAIDTPNTESEPEEPVSIIRRMTAIRKRVTTTATDQDIKYNSEQRSIQQTLPKQTSEPDPEMEAINATLDKLMAIQHPDKTKPVAPVRLVPAYSVETGMERDESYFGKRKSATAGQTFYSDKKSSSEGKIISAMIAANQVLQSGATVKLELLIPVVINGSAIRAGTPVYGIAQIEGERLRIHIPSIRIQDNLLPISLDVYDMDGLEGIYVPGSLNREVAKESAESAIQSSGIAGFDPSGKTQLVTAGISAAKTLLSKKVKQIRITLPAGYKVLLRDNKQTN